MRKLAILLAVGLFATLASCKTINVGGNRNPNKGPIVTLTLPAAFAAGTTGTFTAAWTSGTGPFTVVFTFTGTDTPSVTINNATSPASATVTFVGSVTADTPGTVSVTVTDANAQSGTASNTFTVPKIPNQPPTIAAVAANATCSVAVTVSDPDNDPLTVSASTVPAGFSTPANQTTTDGTSQTLTFSFSAADILAGATGDITFTADDGKVGGTTTATATLNCAAFAPAADHLYAIPTSTTAATGGTVTVVVVTGVPANPFQYLTGCRVCAPTASDINYVAGTFNAGAVGGAAGDVDGFWTGMAPTGFLLPPDNFIQRFDTTDSRWGIDLNVTPLGGHDVTTSLGALCNLGVKFGAAGSWDLTFQQTETVDRTYYQDGTQAADIFWGDITNVDATVPHTVTVN